MAVENIDLAVERAEREDSERRDIPFVDISDDAIDDRIDRMTMTEVFEAFEADDDWLSLAQLCADSQAKSDNFERFGRIMGGMVRDYAKKLAERENG